MGLKHFRMPIETARVMPDVDVVAAAEDMIDLSACDRATA